MITKRMECSYARIGLASWLLNINDRIRTVQIERTCDEGRIGTVEFSFEKIQYV